MCNHFFEAVELSLFCTKSKAGPIDCLFRKSFVVQVYGVENEGTRYFSRTVWPIVGERTAIYRPRIGSRKVEDF